MCSARMSEQVFLQVRRANVSYDVCLKHLQSHDKTYQAYLEGWYLWLFVVGESENQNSVQTYLGYCGRLAWFGSRLS